ncbi:LysR family transcriptional regulator [Rhodococcus sp. 15-2388-1-1a]|jgi:DNA-binding transcriptional LysR family regulator|uniref:LysR family transcriptional regulator n=1 Tax=Nocardiaceae TaxID=85025 RepID=UPI00055F0AAF|nr:MULTISPECIES: LysR family transcriptional regulator [Rhodococcus]OZF02232.1 LysR family transcriptional regulator [Rhodococcus sp. 15-2388-1-1a]
MIDMSALHALRAVAALGTLARAADELGYTSSAISQQIKRLERQIGTPVLAQAGRGVVLTPAGRAVVESAGEVFDALERCVEAARSADEGVARGVVRLVGFSTAVRGLLAPALIELNRRYPDLTVHISEEDPDRALHSVSAGTADLALVHDADGVSAPAPPSVVRQRIHTDFGDVIMKRTHPLARPDIALTPAELARYPWVTSPAGTVCHQWFRRLFAETSAEVDVRHLVDDFSTQLALVEADDVLALVPRLARPLLGADLVAVPLERAPVREVEAAWRRSADASPAIHAVLDVLDAASR